MLSRSLKRYYGPLRLPMQPVAISLPYTQQLISPIHHCTGSPALDRLSSAACHPCYPGRKHPLLPFSQRVSTGLPHLTRGSASPVQVTRLPVGSLALRPATSPFGNLRPLIAQTPLPRATQAYGQLLGRDFNPQDKRLLLRTVTSRLLIIATFFLQLPAETTPRQSGNFEQPQNSFPECGPFFATRSTISLPHLGHTRATSGCDSSGKMPP